MNPEQALSQADFPFTARKLKCERCGIEFRMEITRSDERDSGWEQHRNTFRVYFFEGQQHAVDTFDISDAIFSEVFEWAEQNAGDRLYAITLVALNERGERGLIWLNGYDANTVAGDSIEQRLMAEMHARSERTNPREGHSR